MCYSRTPKSIVPLFHIIPSFIVLFVWLNNILCEKGISNICYISTRSDTTIYDMYLDVWACTKISLAVDNNEFTAIFSSRYSKINITLMRECTNLSYYYQRIRFRIEVGFKDRKGTRLLWDKKWEKIGNNNGSVLQQTVSLRKKSVHLNKACVLKTQW